MINLKLCILVPFGKELFRNRYGIKGPLIYYTLDKNGNFTLAWHSKTKIISVRWLQPAARHRAPSSFTTLTISLELGEAPLKLQSLWCFCHLFYWERSENNAQLRWFEPRMAYILIRNLNSRMPYISWRREYTSRTSIFSILGHVFQR